MATYAVQQDVVDYIPGFVVDDATALEQLIEICERDVDNAMGHKRWMVNETTGLRLDPTQLTSFQAKQLARAVAAQVEYRLAKGEDFFVAFRPDAQSGPDGAITGKEPFLAPKARMELARAGLFRLWGRMVTRRPWRLSSLPNQNIGDFLP